MPTQDATPKGDSETATLEWLVTALQYARSRRQAEVVGYLEDIADDVVFEVEMKATRAYLIRQKLPVPGC